MVKTETKEANPPGYHHPPLSGGYSRYTDYFLISWLAPRRMKRDFVSWVDVEFAETALDTPENRVYYVWKKVEQDTARHSDEGRIQVLENMKHGSFVPQDDGTVEKKGYGESFVHELESALIWVLARMESMGVAFDKEKLLNIGERIRRDIARLETEIYDIIGEQFNLNSPKQLQVILFEKLGIKPTKKNKTGYSVDNDVLEEIAKSYDIARLILEYRGLAKLSSTYVEWLVKSVGTDRRIHTTYDSLGAATGRMSSIEPNLQNIPTGDGYAREIKECFVASWTPLIRGVGGFVSEWSEQTPFSSPLSGGQNWNILLVADYSQIELRILAFLSQDEVLLEAFAHGEDIHARTAFFLFGEKIGADKSSWKATSEQRRIAKGVNFGVIYGITGFWLAKTLDCSPWEAQEYINAFYVKYPGVRVYYDRLLEDARKYGYVETYFGRRRYIPWVNDANKTLRAMAEREAMNMPIQGTAADIIKVSMVDLDANIRNMSLKWHMILQVHDELVFDIPLSEKEVFEKIVRETMEGVLENYERTRSSSFRGTWRWILMKWEEATIWRAAPNLGTWEHGIDHGLGDRRYGRCRLPPITVDISTGANWAEAK